MQKLQKLALDDYLLETNDLNLKLFVLAVNPLFSLTSKKKIELNALIDKYRKEQSKLRLSSIEVYLGASKSEKKIIKKAKAEIGQIAEEPDQEKSELEKKLADLRNKLKQLQARGSIDEKGIKLQTELSDSIKEVEKELGLWFERNDAQQYRMSFEDDFDPMKSKIEVFNKLFGDYKIQGTPAWSLINHGGIQQFTQLSAFAGLWYNPNNLNKPFEEFDNLVYTITGKRKLRYNIIEDKSQNPSIWVFTLGTYQYQQMVKEPDTQKTWSMSDYNKLPIDANYLSMEDAKRLLGR